MKSQPPVNSIRQGAFAAVWIPVDREGALLRDDLKINIEFLKQHKISGFLALGSTGEFPHFNIEERKRILSAISELAAPLPVIANISDISPRVVSELGRYSRQLGLPAVAIMPPGFYPSSQEDLLEHFLLAAESSGLPTLLYNFPELCGSRINLETVAAFAERANILGIKQSGAEFDYHRELISLGREKDFVVFSGADTRLPEVFSLGAVGCICGLANIAPELIVQIYQICRQGVGGDTNASFVRLRMIGQIIDRLNFPLNVAAGMEARGFVTGATKALVSPASEKIYREIVGELRARFSEWELPSA
jgi:4-hydroxy-tetrahydrodipicolinate synthase